MAAAFRSDKPRSPAGNAVACDGDDPDGLDLSIVLRLQAYDFTAPNQLLKRVDVAHQRAIVGAIEEEMAKAFSSFGVKAQAKQMQEPARAVAGKPRARASAARWVVAAEGAGIVLARGAGRWSEVWLKDGGWASSGQRGEGLKRARLRGTKGGCSRSF